MRELDLPAYFVTIMPGVVFSSAAIGQGAERPIGEHPAVAEQAQRKARWAASRDDALHRDAVQEALF